MGYSSVFAQQTIVTDDGTYTIHLTPNESIPMSIVPDKDGIIWFNGYGLMRFDSKCIPDVNGFRKYSTNDSLNCGLINSMALDKNDVLWIVGKECISSFDGNTFKNYYTVNDTTKIWGRFLCVDSGNKKWFIGSPKYLLTFDDTNWKVYCDFLWKPTQSIVSIAADKKNNIWINGQYKYDGTSWEKINIEGGIMSIEDNNTMWIYSPYHLYSYRDSIQTDYSTGIPLPNIQSLAIDKKGIVWIGSTAGLIRFDGKNFKAITSLDFKIFERNFNYTLTDVYSIAVDDNNVKWFSARCGSDALVSLDDSDVSVSEIAPESFTLISNFPNPFNLSTTISFTLSAPGFTELSVYNMAGQQVKRLLYKNLSAGSHTALWDGCDDSGKTVSSGVYFSVLKSGGKTATGKMALVK